MSDPFSGKKKIGGDGADFVRELPSEDTHSARIVALIDIGTHTEKYKGEGEEKERRKMLIAFELDEANSNRENFVVLNQYTLSLFNTSAIYSLAKSILNDGKDFPDDDVDYKRLLGQPCQVQISHNTSKASGKNYAKIASITSMPKKQREQCFKPQRKPFVWFIGHDIKTIPEWVPYWIGKPVQDEIRACLEWNNASDNGDEGVVGAGVGADDSTPF